MVYRERSEPIPNALCDLSDSAGARVCAQAVDKLHQRARVEDLRDLLECEIRTHKALTTRRSEILHRLTSQLFKNGAKMVHGKGRKNQLSTKVFNLINYYNGRYIVPQHCGTLKKSADISAQIEVLRDSSQLLLDNIISYGWSCSLDETMTFVRNLKAHCAAQVKLLARENDTFLRTSSTVPFSREFNFQKKLPSAKNDCKMDTKKKLLHETRAVKEAAYAKVDEYIVDKRTAIEKYLMLGTKLGDIAPIVDCLDRFSRKLSTHETLLQHSYVLRQNIHLSSTRMTHVFKQHHCAEYAREIIAEFKALLETLATETKAFCQKQVQSKRRLVIMMMQHLEANRETFQLIESHVLRTCKYTQFIRSEVTRALGLIANTPSSRSELPLSQQVANETRTMDNHLRAQVGPFKKKLNLKEYDDNFLYSLTKSATTYFQSLNKAWRKAYHAHDPECLSTHTTYFEVSCIKKSGLTSKKEISLQDEPLHETVPSKTELPVLERNDESVEGQVLSHHIPSVSRVGLNGNSGSFAFEETQYLSKIETNNTSESLPFWSVHAEASALAPTRAQSLPKRETPIFLRNAEPVENSFENSMERTVLPQRADNKPVHNQNTESRKEFDDADGTSQPPNLEAAEREESEAGKDSFSPFWSMSNETSECSIFKKTPHST